MPQRIINVPPELVLEHKGVRVYRTYVDDDADQPEKYYFVATDPLDVFDVRSLEVPSARSLKDSQPRPINAPIGTPLVLFQQTKAYFQARMAWDAWFNETEPALIRKALIEGIDWSHIK